MKKISPLIILVIISAFLIFYHFPAIPKYLAYDEVEFTKLALSLDNKPYAPYSQLATGHSTLYFYILLASLKTFGINVFALRFPAAIFGILSVLFFYLIMKKVFSHQNNDKFLNFLVSQFPFFLSLILLSSRWFLNFSRFSFEATFLLFLELVSIYFLISFWREKQSQNIFLIISGLFAGFAFISYTPGRIFFILPIAFLIFNWYRRGMSRLYDKKILIKQFLLFIIPFTIIITPLTLHLSTNQDSRIDKLFFWRNHEMTLNEKIIGTVNNVKTITLMFFTKGDMNGKHNYPGKPALNPILGTLLIIGFIYSLKNYKNLYNKLFLLYFLISLFPSLAIYPWENPSMLRTFTVIPSVIYFIGNAIYHLSSIVPRWSINKTFVSCFLFLVILFSCVYELRTYFKYQVPVFEHSFEIRYPLNKAIKMKNVYEKVP
ncbi:MAG: glycosyltransferase family 39 protein [Patescibacteria group bacterium]|mgnify:CR=1 FL=1